MTNITFNPTNHHYDKEKKVFSISEKDTKFDTSYTIKNEATGKSMKFNLTHSTGPEFAPDTKWVYEGEEGVTLEVCNDPEITKQLAKNYLQAKLRH